MKINLTNFVLPARRTASPFNYKKTSVYAVLPTYKPGATTARLVEDLLRWNPTLRVVVVDDCTPESPESTEIFRRITRLSQRVVLLRTPVNTLKAGALNYALSYIARLDNKPEVILTLDDDVVVDRTTVRHLVVELMSHDTVGAACSQCRVYNKNKNLITRLQGLEYLGFNAIRMADDGFLKGPLVMHGMLTAFRTAALEQAGGFAEGHLIEDYEITTRLKLQGWDVKAAVTSSAWTVVPETFSALWRQRARWSYGGITVILKAKKAFSVLQDLIGHGLFLATLGMIVFLLLSPGTGVISGYVVGMIVVLSVTQLVVWYTFQLWLMRLYKEKDRYDWLIKISLVPEFLYSNIMALVCMGSYLFFFFLTLKHAAVRTSATAAQLLAPVTKAFRVCGYTERWGTRMEHHA